MKKIFLTITLLLALVLPSYAAMMSIKFDTNGFISDGAKVLSKNDAEEMSFYFDFVKKQKQFTILFVTIETTDGKSAGKIASTIAERVKIAEKDNLLVFLVAPKDAKVGVELGENVKEVLSSETINKVVNTKMAPSFSTGDYSEAMKLSMYSIAQALEPSLAFVDVKAAMKSPVENTASSKSMSPNIVPFSIILIGLFLLMWLVRYSDARARERAIVYHRCGFGRLFGNAQLLYEKNILE